MFRKRSFWIILIVALAILGGAAYLYFDRTAATEAADEEAAVQSTTVRQGDITISATGAGAVVPATEIALGFTGNGVLKEVLVQVGDKVQAGDVLARLDDTAAQQALANAELQLRQATMQTDASATETGTSYSDIAVEQAQLNLDTAQANLDDLLNWEPDEDEVAQAQGAVEAAQAAYDAALGNEAASSSNITTNRINLDQAQRSLESAQENWDTAYDPGRDWELGDPRRADKLENERAAADEALLRAQESLTVAQANYNAAASSTNHSSSTSAQNNVLNAELALAAALSGPAENEITAAETTVRQAELNLQQALLGRESDALSLAQSQLNLEAAQATVEDTVLIAPMDGTIMTVNGSVGESASAGFITMADLEQPLIEIYLDETDLDKVGLDFEVDVIFDALPDDVFTGHIVQIDPMLSSLNGVTTVRALVLLDEDSFAKPQNLPVGLNATVDVIGGRALGALLVPVEALRELSPGEYAVFVMEDGEPRLRFVEVGLMDFTFAEILSGLEAGEIVTTGIVETN